MNITLDRSKPLHITQLIPKHMMFTHRYSGKALIARLARDLAMGDCINAYRSGQLKNHLKNHPRYHYNLHHLAIADHPVGAESGDVLELITVWKQWWDEDEGDEYAAVRMEAALLSPEEALTAGWQVLGGSPVEDANDAADVAVSLMDKIASFMRYHRQPPLLDYSIHRVVAPIPAEIWQWSEYQI